MKPTIWDDAKNDDRLRELWDEGLSGSKIGDRFGVSRSAVLARARRLHLPPRVVQPVAAGVPKKRRHRKKEKPPGYEEDARCITAKKQPRPAKASTRAELYAMLADAWRNTR